MVRSLNLNSDFNKNVFTLLTGTTIAQAIPIAVSPILTRLYSPEDFGVFALFVAVTTIFGSIANARYELVIMLPRKDEDAINIFALGFIITSSISFMLFIFVLFFKNYLVKLLNNTEIEYWLYFTPIAVFLTGIFNLLTYYNTRLKEYKNIAKATLLKSIIYVIIQISIGIIKSGVTGLITGQLFSQFFANIKLFTKISKNKNLFSKIKKVKIISLGKRYKDFPKFSMWAALANTLSFQLTNVLISSLYNVKTLGLYSLVQRVLGVPSSLIGSSIGKVFFQEAAKEKQITGNAVKTFYLTIIKLTMVGLPFFGIIYFLVQDIFAFVFGEDWRIAGDYAKIVIPLFFVRFIVGPISIVNTVFEKNKNGLIFQVSLLFGVVVAFILGKYFSLEFIELIFLLTYILILIYFLFLIYLIKLIKGIRLN